MPELMGGFGGGGRGGLMVGLGGGVRGGLGDCGGGSGAGLPVGCGGGGGVPVGGGRVPLGGRAGSTCGRLGPLAPWAPGRCPGCPLEPGLLGGGGCGGGRDGTSGSGNIEGKPFAGIRVILFGFPDAIKHQYKLKVMELGGTVLESIDYETASHIAVGGSIWEGEKLIWKKEGKIVVSKDWINQTYCKRSKVPDNNDLILTPSTDTGVRRIVSTSKRSHSHRFNNMCSKRSIKRKLSYGPDIEGCKCSFEEEILHNNHHIFHCPVDSSIWTSLLEFCVTNKQRLTREVIIPGTDKKHKSIVTSNELKTYFKTSYGLMRNLHKAGLTLCGRFSSRSFLIGRYKNMRLSSCGSARKIKPGDEERDIQRYVEMIKDELFSDLAELPSEIKKWLKLVGKSSDGLDELVLQSIHLAEEHEATAMFKTLFSMFESMEGTDPQGYLNVKAELSHYNNWKSTVEEEDWNLHLYSTLEHVNQGTGKATNYADDITGLLDLLRNTKEHSARFGEPLFILIVNYNFPDLLSDFQQAMYKEGYVVRHNT